MTYTNQENTKTNSRLVVVTLSISLVVALFFIVKSTEAYTLVGMSHANTNSTFSMSTISASGMMASTTDGEVKAIVWPEIKAKSAIVIDPVGNRIIYEKNADAIMPTASLLKIMTAAVVDSFMNMNPKLAERKIKINSNISQNRADRLLATNSSWNVDDLTKFMLIGSSNKAADTLARSIVGETAFVSYMNFKAKQFGLSKTSFSNATGLSITNNRTKKETPAGLTTAREMATMFWAIIANHPGLLDITQYDKATFVNGKLSVEVPNTNREMNDLPIRFGKTGFTDLSGGNLAIVLQRSETSHPYIVVVMGSTEADRFSDVYNLATTTLAHYKQ